MDNAKLGTAYKEPKLVFQNQRDGTFKDVSAQAGSSIAVPQVSRGLAVGDLFNRGRLDIVVENLTGAPMILEAQSNPAHHWVSFDLEGSHANRLAAQRTGPRHYRKTATARRGAERVAALTLSAK